MNKYRTVANNTCGGRNEFGSVITCPAAERLKHFIVFAGSALGLFMCFVLSSISYLCSKPSLSLLNEKNSMFESQILVASHRKVHGTKIQFMLGWWHVKKTPKKIQFTKDKNTKYKNTISINSAKNTCLIFKCRKRESKSTFYNYRY